MEPQRGQDCGPAQERGEDEVARPSLDSLFFCILFSYPVGAKRFIDGLSVSQQAPPGAPPPTVPVECRSGSTVHEGKKVILFLRAACTDDSKSGAGINEFP